VRGACFVSVCWAGQTGRFLVGSRAARPGAFPEPGVAAEVAQAQAA
jgi:hypothetical protein